MLLAYRDTWKVVRSFEYGLVKGITTLIKTAPLNHLALPQWQEENTTMSQKAGQYETLTCCDLEFALYSSEQ